MHSKKRKYEKSENVNQPTLSEMFARQSNAVLAPSIVGATRKSKHCFLLDLNILPSENKCEIVIYFDSHLFSGTSHIEGDAAVEIEIGPNSSMSTESTSTEQSCLEMDETIEGNDSEENDNGAMIVSQSSGK